MSNLLKFAEDALYGTGVADAGGSADTGDVTISNSVARTEKDKQQDVQGHALNAGFGGTTGRAGEVAGYSDKYIEQAQSFQEPTYTPYSQSESKMSRESKAQKNQTKHNSIAHDMLLGKRAGWMTHGVLPSAALMLGSYGTWKGYKELMAYKDRATIKGKHLAKTKIPRALLAAVASGAAGYTASNYANNYIESGRQADIDLKKMQARFRSINGASHMKASGLTPDMIKRSVAGTTVAAGLATALGLGAFGLSHFGTKKGKEYIDSEMHRRVNNATKYWTPAAAVAGFGLGYAGNDIKRMYNARKLIKAKSNFAGAYNSLIG